jgi:hypothetical protein
VATTWSSAPTRRPSASIDGDVDRLDADVQAPARGGQVVRVAPGHDDPPPGLTGGQRDGPGNSATAADHQHGPVFQ